MTGDGNIPIHRPDVGDEEIAAVTAVLRSGWLTTGPECHAFEEELAAFVGARHAVVVNSCTAALHLGLDAVGVRRGDHVLVPALTFAATAEVVAYFGAIPVLVDVEPRTLCIDAGAASHAAAMLAGGGPYPGVRAPSPGKAILPVHYGGQMADVDGVAEIARHHGLRVIEDAAHALPSWTRAPRGPWRSVGTTSEITCFSFYATKTITTGEGGALVTDDAAIADRARRMSLHGLSNDAWKRNAGGRWDYEILDTGYKYNLTDVAAALGRVQLRKANALLEARRRVAERYDALLAAVDEVEIPTVDDDRRPSYHLYPLRLRRARLGIDRDGFIEALRERGVGVSVHWRPLHLHPYYRDTFGLRPEHFPVASAEWRRLVSLPIYPSLGDEEIERVAGAVRDLCRRHARGRLRA